MGQNVIVKCKAKKQAIAPVTTISASAATTIIAVGTRRSEQRSASLEILVETQAGDTPEIVQEANRADRADLDNGCESELGDQEGEENEVLGPRPMIDKVLSTR